MPDLNQQQPSINQHTENVPNTSTNITIDIATFRQRIIGERKWAELRVLHVLFRVLHVFRVKHEIRSTATYFFVLNTQILK
jgi:hypothetical protein